MPSFLPYVRQQKSKKEEMITRKKKTNKTGLAPIESPMKHHTPTALSGPVSWHLDPRTAGLEEARRLRAELA